MKTIFTIFEDLKDAAITIKDHVNIKLINSLGSKFDTYVTFLNEKLATRNCYQTWTAP